MIGGWLSDPMPTAPGTPAALAHRGTSRHAVRAPLSRIVGRDALVADLATLLDRDDTRLVTLTGPGGIGKTRLALEVAMRVQHDFAHGACFVPLASIRAPEAVPGAIAEALGLRERNGQPLREVLASVLRSQHLLLVLDNFEHVAPAALWIGDLLVTCPRVKALVTTRVLLRIQGEQHVPVPPLPVPDGGREAAEDPASSPAVALFVDRARAIQPSFALTAENREAVSAICRQLDGLPLAIELAAARINVLSTAAILARLTDQLTLLTSTMRDVPARLRTMRNAIAWSYDLLQSEERELFRRLAIFAGSFTIGDAVAVGMQGTVGAEEDPGATEEADLERVASLLDQSLIQQVPAEHDETRFRMLATIREFGLERLEESGELDRIAQRHALHVLALAERAAPQLTGPDQAIWLRRLEGEHDDIRAAFVWFQEQGEHALLLRLAVALWRFGYTRGYLTETRQWIDTAIAADPEPSAVLAEALNGSGVLASVQGDIRTATSRHEAARQLGESLGDRRAIALALNGLGNVAEVEGDLDLAFARYEEARDVFAEIDDRRGVAVMLTNIGNLHWELERAEEAAARHTEARALFREVGDPRGMAWAAANLGTLAISGRDLERAVEYLREAAGLYRELGDQSGIIEALERFAEIARLGGQRDRQATLAAAAAGIRQVTNIPVPASIRERYDEAILELRRHLGDAFASAWHAGQELSIDEAVELAMSTEPSAVVEELVSASTSEAARAHGLTRRELDVLRLMADGLTNQEIAERLYLSTRTVTSHASNILSKLDLTTRTAAVAYAIRNNLA